MNKTHFTENLEKKTLVVERNFAAPVVTVWAAWTQKELLEKWWAPMPYKAVSKSFNFREGGHWHYYMESPEGEKHWCLVTYNTIEPERSFTAHDCFCDEDKNINAEMPSNNWDNVFIPKGNQTQVKVTLTFVSVEDLQATIKMGFKEGFTMGLDQLEALLEANR